MILNFVLVDVRLERTCPICLVAEAGLEPASTDYEPAPGDFNDSSVLRVIFEKLAPR